MIFFLSEKEAEEEKGGGAIGVGVSTCSQFGIFAAGKSLVNQHRVLKCSHRFHPQTGLYIVAEKRLLTLNRLLKRSHQLRTCLIFY